MFFLLFLVDQLLRNLWSKKKAYPQDILMWCMNSFDNLKWELIYTLNSQQNLKCYNNTMPHYPTEIEYSEKYYDDHYEYRHVVLPK